MSGRRTWVSTAHRQRVLQQDGGPGKGNGREMKPLPRMIGAKYRYMRGCSTRSPPRRPYATCLQHPKNRWLKAGARRVDSPEISPFTRPGCSCTLGTPNRQPPIDGERSTARRREGKDQRYNGEEGRVVMGPRLYAPLMPDDKDHGHGHHPARRDGTTEPADDHPGGAHEEQDAEYPVVVHSTEWQEFIRPSGPENESPEESQ